MQHAIQKAHEWTQNMNSEDVKIYLDELSGNNITFAEDVSMRSVKTKQYKIILPVYVNIEEETTKLKQEQKDLLSDYIYVINELIFGERNDIIMNERYELLAKRLTQIQQDLLTYQQYANLNPESRNAMIHPPQITKISRNSSTTKKKGHVLKGGDPGGPRESIVTTSPTPQVEPLVTKPLAQRVIKHNVKDKVKTLLQSKYVGKN
jgi:hypothetical protein